MKLYFKKMLFSIGFLISCMNGEVIHIGVLEITEEVIELSGPTQSNPSAKQYSTLYCPQDEIGAKSEYTVTLSIDTLSREVFVNGTSFNPRYFNYRGTDNNHTSLNFIGENVWSETFEQTEQNEYCQVFETNASWEEDRKVRYLSNSRPQVTGKVSYIENYSILSYSLPCWEAQDLAPYRELNTIECVQTSEIVGNLRNYQRYPTRNEQINIIRVMREILRTSTPDTSNSSGVRKKSRAIAIGERG